LQDLGTVYSILDSKTLKLSAHRKPRRTSAQSRREHSHKGWDLVDSNPAEFATHAMEGDSKEGNDQTGEYLQEASTRAMISVRGSNQTKCFNFYKKYPS
jgi:hypothetical protein